MEKASSSSSSYPVSSAEVNSLRKVVALVKATVVGSGERHHKLPRTLISPVHLRRQREICEDSSSWVT